MRKWLFEDGTTVILTDHSEPIISGGGRVATALRRDTRGGVRVALRPQPSDLEQIDPTNPVHVDLWLTDRARVLDVGLVSRPALPVTRPSPDPDFDPSRVY